MEGRYGSERICLAALFRWGVDSMAENASRAGYRAVMDAVSAAEEDGIGAYDMCVAVELYEAVKECVDGIRIKMANGIVLGSVEDLFRIALDVFHGSAGACTPKDAAQGTVKCFIHCGMDVKKTEKYAKSKIFALMC